MKKLVTSRNKPEKENSKRRDERVKSETDKNNTYARNERFKYLIKTKSMAAHIWIQKMKRGK